MKRIVLTREDWLELVAGEVVVKQDTELILQDIGYDFMIADILKLRAYPFEILDLNLEVRLLKYLESGPKTKRQMYKRFGGHVSSKFLEYILFQLYTKGQARGVKVQTGGRPAEVWEAIDAPN